MLENLFSKSQSLKAWLICLGAPTIVSIPNKVRTSPRTSMTSSGEEILLELSTLFPLDTLLLSSNNRHVLPSEALNSIFRQSY